MWELILFRPPFRSCRDKAIEGNLAMAKRPPITSVGGEGEGHEGHGWDGAALFCNAKRCIINQPRDPGCHKQQMCLA